MYLVLCGVLTLPVAAQYCSPSIYNGCSGTLYEYIGNVTIGSLNNSSGCVVDPAYSDFTALPAAVLPANVATTITVQVNNYWSSDEVQIFCDWDNNGVLSDAGEIFIIPDPVGPGGSGSTNQLYTGTITPPFGGASVRMRVLLYYGPGSQNPCPNSGAPSYDSYGEIEDYTISVSGGGPVPCSTTFSSPGGPGTVLVSNNPCAPLAGAAYFWAFTFSPGTFPAGGWHGLDIGLAQLVNWYLSGYPFTGTLDGAGASSFGAGGLPNIPIWEVTTLWAPGYGTYLTSYAPQTYTIP